MDFYPSLPSPYSKPIEQQFVRVKDLVQERWRKWRIESVIAVKMHFTETIFMLDPSPPSPFWTAILHPFRLNDRALSVWWRKWRIKVVPFFKLCSGKCVSVQVLTLVFVFLFHLYLSTSITGLRSRHCRWCRLLLLRSGSDTTESGRKCYWVGGKMLLSQTRNNASFCLATQ